MVSCTRFWLMGLYVILIVVAFIIGLALALSGGLLLAANSLPLLSNIAKVASFVSHEEYLRLSSYVLIVIGLVAMSICLLGCVGAFKRKDCLIASFVLLFSIILCLQFLLGILALVGWMQIDESISDNARCTFTNCKQLPEESLESYKYSMQYFQAKLECCGIDGPMDYKEKNIMSVNDTLPWQCCTLRFPEVTYGDLQGVRENDFEKFKSFYILDYKNCTDVVNSYNTEGCRTAVKSWMTTYVPSLVGFCVGILLVQLLLVLVSTGVCMSHRHHHHKH